MIKSKNREAWTTTPDTHRLMFKSAAGEEAPAYFTRIFLADGLTADDLVEIPLADIPAEPGPEEPTNI